LLFRGDKLDITAKKSPYWTGSEIQISISSEVTNWTQLIGITRLVALSFRGDELDITINIDEPSFRDPYSEVA